MYCCDIYIYDTNCAFVGYNKNTNIYIYIVSLLRTVMIQNLQPSTQDYQPFPAGVQL